MNNENTYSDDDFVNDRYREVNPKEKISPKVSIHLSPHNEKRQARRKQTGEDFTPSKLVNEMLDKLPEDQWEKGKTFCDPACGNGNMLIEVLKRKLSKGHNYLEAISAIYGVDIMEENIIECRLRLFMIIKEHLKNYGEKLNNKEELELIKILGKNIFFLRLETYPNGALDEKWKFDFNRELSEDDAQVRQKNYHNKKLLKYYGFA